MWARANKTYSRVFIIHSKELAWWATTHEFPCYVLFKFVCVAWRCIAFDQAQQEKLVSERIVWIKCQPAISMVTTMWRQNVTTETVRVCVCACVGVRVFLLLLLFFSFLLFILFQNRSHSIYFALAHLKGSKMWPDSCDYIFPYSKNVLRILKHAIDSNLSFSSSLFAAHFCCVIHSIEQFFIC